MTVQMDNIRRVQEWLENSENHHTERSVRRLPDCNPDHIQNGYITHVPDGHNHYKGESIFVSSS